MVTVLFAIGLAVYADMGVHVLCATGLAVYTDMGVHARMACDAMQY